MNPTSVIRNFIRWLMLMVVINVVISGLFLLMTIFLGRTTISQKITLEVSQLWHHIQK